jgi:hypothetical protein
MRRTTTVLAVAGLAGGAILAAPLAAGQETVADNGFRPQANGFSFPNYGNTLIEIEPDGGYVDTGVAPADLGPAQMASLFGRGVCTAATGPCTLTPAAAQWMEEANAQMAGGHCYGFAVETSRGYQGLWAAPSFGAPVVPQLAIGGNAPLQGLIARGMAQQWVANISLGSPTAALSALRTRLGAGQQAMLVILKADMTGGHAITPYAVEDLGAGVFAVKVYDNNFPGAEREVTIDTAKDTWSYQASQNPNDPTELYTGGAGIENIGVVDPDDGAGVNAFPPAGGAEASASAVGRTPAPPARMRLSWSGADHVGRQGEFTVRDAQGRVSGCEDGADGRTCRNEIPGAEQHFRLPGGTPGGEAATHPEYTVPAAGRYRLGVGGRGLEGRARESVAAVADDSFVEVEGIDLRPGERDRIDVLPHARGVAFRAGKGRPDAVRLELGDSHRGRHVEVGITVAGVRGGKTITAGLRRGDRSLLVDTRRGGATRLRLDVTRGGASGATTRSGWVRVPAGATLRVRHGDTRLRAVLDRTPGRRGGAEALRLA